MIELEYGTGLIYKYANQIASTTSLSHSALRASKLFRWIRAYSFHASAANGNSFSSARASRQVGSSAMLGIIAVLLGMLAYVFKKKQQVT
jgi:lipoprotein signal peptidase